MIRTFDKLLPLSMSTQTRRLEWNRFILIYLLFSNNYGLADSADHRVWPSDGKADHHLTCADTAERLSIRAISAHLCGINVHNNCTEFIDCLHLWLWTCGQLLCGQHLLLDSFSFCFKIFALSSSSSSPVSLCSEYSRAFCPPSPGAPALTRTWNSQVDIEQTAATWPSCTRSTLPPGWDFWPASQTAWPSVLCLWWRWSAAGGGGGGSGARWNTIQ